MALPLLPDCSAVLGATPAASACLDREAVAAVLDHRLRRRLPFPFLVESKKVDARGTSTSAKAGLGLFTVRAQSQAMTVSLRPTIALSDRGAPAPSPP